MEEFNKQISEKQAMELAILEAKKGQTFVSPNPCVGCIILDKNHLFLSSGFYSHYGAIHAEIVAINKIKEKKSLEGAHLFVTLEPCAHFGKNPPCVDTLLNYPFASITYGQEDPNPKTQGKGLKKIREKGISLKSFSFFQDKIHKLYESFTVNMQEERSFFALKVACSLDGILALNHGDSQWITGELSREYVSFLRACYDAVLIGVGTFLEDNPRLNSRKKISEKKSNKVCILDPFGRSLKLITQSKMASVRPLNNILVITQKDLKKENYPFRVMTLPWNSNQSLFDLKFLAKKLYKEEGISSLLIEGGAKTASSFLNQNQVDRLYQFINPCLLGGAKALAWTNELSIKTLTLKKILKSKEILCLGEDILITGKF